MPPKRPVSSPAAGQTPKKSRPSVPKKVNWSPEEDQAIIALRTTSPPTPWAEIVAAVNNLPPPAPGNRNQNSLSVRWYRTLKFEDPRGENLNEEEANILARAVADVEEMTDKWWFVAARYMELRKKKEDNTRELSKVGAKKWWDKIKSARSHQVLGQSTKSDQGKQPSPKRTGSNAEEQVEDVAQGAEEWTAEQAEETPQGRANKETELPSILEEWH